LSGTTNNYPIATGAHRTRLDALDRYLPIAELPVPWFKAVAALEGKLLTAPYHNEKIAAIESRPRIREPASYFISRPDTEVYLPHSVYSLFWQMIQLARSSAPSALE